MRDRRLGSLLAMACALSSLVARADEAADHLAAAGRANADGDLPTAISELKAGLALQPSAKAFLLLGSIQIKVGQLDEARAALDQVQKLDPKRRSAVSRLIRDLTLLGRTRLQITSTPPGATVYVDLKAEGQRGKTPLTLPVPPGRHRLILELDGHDRATVEARAVDGQDVPVAAQLQPRGCEVKLATPADGTIARVDGGPPVATPAQLRLSPGEHKVELSRRGAKTRLETIKCVDRPLTVELPLEEIATGTLAVLAPAGASVSIDGRLVTGAEAARLAVAPGEHLIEVAGAGGAAWQTATTLRAGDEISLAPRLATPVAAPAPSAPVVDRPLARNPWFWVGLVGAAAVGAGAASALAVGTQPRDAAIPATTAGSAVLTFR